VPCLQELPFLQEYYERYKEQGLVVLAISLDGPDTLAKVRSTVKRKDWTMNILLDQEGSTAAVLNPRGTNPYTMFIDRKGRLAHDHEGYTAGDEKAYEGVIKGLIAE
jgi:peroxiredoxin